MPIGCDEAVFRVEVLSRRSSRADQASDDRRAPGWYHQSEDGEVTGPFGSRDAAWGSTVLTAHSECPECGDAGGPDGHDDNGGRGSDLTFCCRACGEQFDAESLVDRR